MGLKRWVGKTLVKRGANLMRAKSNGTTPPYETRGWDALFGTIAVTNAEDIWKRFTTQEAMSVYGNHAVVFACVRALAMAIQEAPLQVGKETKKGWKPDTNHWLNDVLDTPNKVMTQGELIGFMVANLMLTGASYTWELRGGTGGQLSELWPLPTWWCDTVWSNQPADPIAMYTVKQGKSMEKKHILPMDMTFLRFTDPANIYGHVGPMQAALKDVQTDQERSNYIIEMLENLKVPGLVLKQPAEFTPEQKEDIKEAIGDLIGKGKRGSPLLLEGEGAEAMMMAPLKDLDWPGLSMLSESRICATFQVPPIVAHVRVGLEKSTYSNYEEAKRQFYRSTMAALWRYIGKALTRAWIANEPSIDDKDLQLKFITSEISEMQESQSDKADRALRLFMGGLITRGRAAEISGEPEPPKEMADVYVLPANLLEIGPTGETLRAPEGAAHDPDENFEETSDEDDEDDETKPDDEKDGKDGKDKGKGKEKDKKK